jgi:hypothetical protein
MILLDVKLAVFSVVGFYARRMRRIAPAFAAMALSQPFRLDPYTLRIDPPYRQVIRFPGD